MKKLQLLLAIFLLLNCNLSQNAWLVEQSNQRVRFVVNTGNVDRLNTPVEIEIDLNELGAHATDDLNFETANLRLLEVQQNGVYLQTIAPVQFDIADTAETAILTFLLPDTTKAGVSRYFECYFGEFDNPPLMQPNPVSVTTVDDHEGQQSFQIDTQNATYFYHIQGAGFASLDDLDGNDWLSYNPGVGAQSNSGSGGMYRGVPNMGYPEGYCHPGKEVSTSRIVHSGPVKVTIESESLDKKMQCRWDIFPEFARLTVQDMRPPYWFLYEGTPGGELEVQSDICVRPGNVRTLCSESWEGDIESEDPGEWLYFGDPAVNRSLFLVQHVDDDHMDSYWPMNEEMTVFGFGRLDLNKYMTRQPNQFTIGLVNSLEYDRLRRHINSAYQPLRIEVLAPERRP